MADLVMQDSGILDFPKLFKKDETSDSYTAIILLDSENEVKRIADAIQDAIKRGVTEPGRDSDGKKTAPPFAGHDPADKTWLATLSLPLKNGDTEAFSTSSKHAGKLRKDVNPEFAGRWYLKVSTNTDMAAEGLLVDTQRKPLTSRDLHSGVLVRAKIWFIPWTFQGRSGVKALLTALVKTADGELTTKDGTVVYSAADADPFAGFNLPAADDTADEGPFAGMGI